MLGIIFLIVFPVSLYNKFKNAGLTGALPYNLGIIFSIIGGYVLSVILLGVGSVMVDERVDAGYVVLLFSLLTLIMSYVSAGIIYSRGGKKVQSLMPVFQPPYPGYPVQGYPQPGYPVQQPGYPVQQQGYPLYQQPYPGQPVQGYPQQQPYPQQPYQQPYPAQQGYAPGAPQPSQPYPEKQPVEPQQTPPPAAGQPYPTPQPAEPPQPPTV